MKIIGFYENNKQSLVKLVSLAKAENVNFFDYSTMLDRVIDETCNYRFLKRLYNEALFLNSIYLDYRNHVFTNNSELALSYNLKSKKEAEELIAICREVHKTIHGIGN